MHIVAIAMVSTFFSCVDSEKDLYDPSYQTSNPMGEGFTAPEGFDWAMTGTTAVTVEADDSQYSTLVEILDANPFSTSEYNVLAAGVATPDKAFSQEVTYTQGATFLYIRKTDSRKRVSVSTWDIPGAQTTTKALKATATTRTSITVPTYTQETYNTTGAIELSGTDDWSLNDKHLESGKSYIIKNNFSGKINNSGEHLSGNQTFTLYVEGKWTPNSEFVQRANIIVLNNGTIDTSSKSSFQVADNSSLTIQSGGTFTGKDFKLATNVLVKNFGSITVNSMKNLNTSSTIYNAVGAKIIIAGDASDSEWSASSVFVDGSIFNLGQLTLQSGYLTVNSNKERIFYNGEHGTFNVTNFVMGGTTENYGTINAVKVSSGGNPTFTNNGTFNVTNFVIKGTAENYGTINAVKVSSDGNPTVTNNCSFYVKDSFSFNNGSLTMNKGILAASVEHSAFIPIPTITCQNCNINLNNGSMIKVGVGNILNVKLYASGDNHSLVKATTSISTEWTTEFNGNLDIECPAGEFAKGQNSYKINFPAELYEPNKSTAVITSCSETSEIPDPTPDPTNPTFPIVLENNKEYTYTFEDQWPLYGDYDMNDVVMTIKNRKHTLDNANKVKEFSFSINLDAVGATKSIAAAIMFDAIPASAISQAVVLGNSNLVKSFSLSNKNIENGQDYAVVPLFDNAHAALGSSKYEPINTVSGYASNTNAKNITFTMKFDTPSLTAEAFNINKLNIFIIVEGNSNKRREIHVAGYQPTKLANTDLFGGNNDGSSVSGKKYYISKENLAWGIIVPTNYKWTLEYNNIKSVYSKFESWVKSAGTENKNWWNDFNEAKVFQTNKN